MYISFNQIDQLEKTINSIVTSNLDVSTHSDLREREKEYYRNAIVSTIDKILKLEL